MEKNLTFNLTTSERSAAFPAKSRVGNKLGTVACNPRDSEG